MYKKLEIILSSGCREYPVGYPVFGFKINRISGQCRKAISGKISTRYLFGEHIQVVILLWEKSSTGVPGNMEASSDARAGDNHLQVGVLRPLFTR